MKRPGVLNISPILQHSKIADDYWLTEMMDLSGQRDCYYSGLIEKRCPSMGMQYNKLNKKDRKINKEDMNLYGYWTD